MKKQKKIKKEREPSLLRKIILIHYEQNKRRKVVRQLQKQSWSFDFLALLLVKASKIANQNLSLTITNKDGTSYTLTYDKAKESPAIDQLDDSIFNHLDDDAAIADYIAKNSRR